MAWDDQFEIHARTGTDQPYLEVAKGSRLEVYGSTPGSTPTFTAGAGHYFFDKTGVGSIKIQGIQVAVGIDGKNLFLGKAVTDHLGGKPVDYTNEQLIIATLVRMLGGVVTITEHELKEVNKSTKIEATRSDQLFGVAEPRLVISLKDRT